MSLAHSPSSVPQARPFFTTPPYAVTWTPPQGVAVPVPPPPSSRMREMLEPGSWAVMPAVAMIFGALVAVIFHFSFVVSPPRVAFARTVFARASAAVTLPDVRITAEATAPTTDTPVAAAPHPKKRAGKPRSR